VVFRWGWKEKIERRRQRGSISNLNPTMIEKQIGKMKAEAAGIKMLVSISHRN
jgi:hypothetical protein